MVDLTKAKASVDVDLDTGRVAWVAALPNRHTPAVGAPGDWLAAPLLVADLQQQTLWVSCPQGRAGDAVRQAHFSAGWQDEEALVGRINPLDIAHRNLTAV
jgi:hypothetical protein